MDGAPQSDTLRDIAIARAAARMALLVVTIACAPLQSAWAQTGPTLVPAVPELSVPFEELEPPEFAPPELVVPPNCGCTLWLVSTRAVGCNVAPGQLCYAIGDGHGNWIDSNFTEFRSTDQAGVPTVIFVHGNRHDAQDARVVGQAIFARLARELPPDRPMRFVIWSWPSDRIVHSLRKDVRVKAIRGEEEGKNVANFVAALDRNVPILLIGHSYGARVIGPALHWLSLVDAASAAPPQRRRAVFMAGGLDYDWLAPQGKYRGAFDAVERGVVMFNPCDNVLKWYPHLWGRGGPEALGYVGLPSAAFAAWGDRIDAINVEPILGKDHALYDYYLAAPIWHILATEAMFESPTLEPATAN